ncbi:MULTISPECIES: bifunctional hydroxymethylpyrimidine kinase/phosphomethylpyrimidine kinase [unclassified Rothia (in: high G+C Gram-positive bacteria)]|uniref:bifunctional hydroxymethylpyrimidine kinase/phosphomethylpyrimidine kinase n=1 Tax=unclassified Rothia (in: high G+C Gram-positive bacteria) TaxID=2689056 RepID=UPI002447D0A2|nr:MULTISPECIES: bifunctional hydroxymethylpyrimidine kinase/phosphomethylpyrimidine kinase [unclassified Rothia (in: high G+C Gram-positive bacteria)]
MAEQPTVRTSTPATNTAVGTLNVPRVLSIAGTDPSGGAGIQADLKSITASGGYGMCVTTSLVAQNTCGVREVFTPPLEFLTAQLAAVFDDVTVDAVKIGMLGDADTIRTVRTWLSEHPVPVVVLDPVMIASSGDRLLQAEAEQALRDLVPLVDVITPNVPELAVLCQKEPAQTFDEAHEQAANLAADTGTTVIVKGGHLHGEDAGNTAVFPDGTCAHVRTPRLESRNTHGTGCSLSSSLATRLGVELLQHTEAAEHAADQQLTSEDTHRALQWSTRWLHESIAAGAGLQVGSGEGHGPVDHAARARRLEAAASSYPWHHLLATTDSEGNTLDGTSPERLLPVSPVPAGKAVVKPAGPWTAALWAAGGETWHQILDLPFVRALGEGTLDEDLFAFYLDQDALYLRDYSRALATLSARADTAAAQVHWAAGAHEAIAAESQLHEGWLANRARLGGASPITMGYTNFLRASAAGDDYVVGAAAILPCYWLYEEVGAVLSSQNHADHPYAEWLSMYGGEDFAADVARSLAEVERAFEAASPAQRVRAARAYLSACVYEREFFDQAHRALR